MTSAFHCSISGLVEWVAVASVILQFVWSSFSLSRWSTPRREPSLGSPMSAQYSMEPFGPTSRANFSAKYGSFWLALKRALSLSISAGVASSPFLYSS